MQDREWDHRYNLEDELNEIYSKEKVDEDIPPSDTIPITNSTPNSLEGPMTRARARHLNYEVRSFLMLHTNIHENGMLLKSSDVLLLRNMGSAQLTSSELWFMQSTTATPSLDTPFTSSQLLLSPTSSSTPSLRSSNKRLHAQD